MTSTEIPAESRCPRWVKITLALSLAINLLIVGAVVGAAVAHRGAFDARARNHEAALGPYTRALTPADRRMVGMALRTRMREMLGTRREARARRSRILEALRARPFDAAAFEKAVAAQQDLVMQGLEVGQRMVLKRIEAMSPQERARFADRLERAFSPAGTQARDRLRGSGG